jgi:membrane protease YdiL (CAAX protease family)
MTDATIENRQSKMLDGAAVLFATALPSVMSWLEFKVLGEDGQEMPALMRSVFFLGKIVQFTFPIIYIAWLDATNHFRWACPPERGFFGKAASYSVAVWCERLPNLRPSAQGIGLGIGFALAVAAGMFVLYFGFLRGTELLGDAPAKINEWLKKIGFDSPSGYMMMAAFVSIPHSFFEEYYWRWFVFGRLQRHVPVWLAITLSSLAFMAHHVVVLSFYFPGKFWIGAVPFSLCVAGGGAAWAWLYYRTRNLYATWLSHLLVDLAIMVVGYDLIKPYWTLAP